MEIIYALINNGVVVNTIVASSEFISQIENQYDNCIRIDQLEVIPGVDWLYDGQNFTKPEENP